jgi:hypothetical protein
MKSRFLLLLLCCCLDVTAQVRGSLEQIYYYDESGGFAMGPLVQLQNKKDWFVEARYNYEEARSVSFYIGKAYEHEGDFTYSIVPLFGGVVGRFKGGSAALNMDLTYKTFYFSSQSQYTFSVEDEVDNFYFTWSELGYQPLTWFYGGLALQETYFPKLAQHVTCPGIVLGFTHKRWTVPLYAFKTGDNTSSFVCSILYEW